MDLGNPAALFSSLFIGTVGFAVALFGKKQANIRCILAGGAMCLFLTLSPPSSSCGPDSFACS